tara:strand:+ start:527 stop:772 length:246 start_codon:yes stop_codon:yes gene_type:complete
LKEAGKVLRNEKQNTTDEFLVKKKEPLIIPPDLDKIPEPGTVSEEETNDKDEIQKILKAPQSTKDNNNSSTEDTILEKIKK